MLCVSVDCLGSNSNMRKFCNLVFNFVLNMTDTSMYLTEERLAAKVLVHERPRTDIIDLIRTLISNCMFAVTRFVYLPI